MVSESGDLSRPPPIRAERERGMNYFYQNYDSLKQRYPNMIVAILGQQVIGSDVDDGKLDRDLKARGIDTRYVYVDSTNRDELPYITT